MARPCERPAGGVADHAQTFGNGSPRRTYPTLPAWEGQHRCRARRMGPRRPHFPQPRRPVTIGGGHERAVGTERHPVHAAAGVRLEGGSDRAPAGHVPQPDGPVVAIGGGEEPAVRLNATPVTPRVMPGLVSAARDLTSWPVAGFHSWTVPSSSALASSLPSRLNATSFTPPTALVSAWRGDPTGRPLDTSHSRTVPSLPSEAASSLPSG